MRRQNLKKSGQETVRVKSENIRLADEQLAAVAGGKQPISLLEKQSLFIYPPRN
jgi:hypothetical protein